MAQEIEHRVAPAEAHTQEHEVALPYGWGFQAFVLLVVMAAIIATVVALSLVASMH